MRENSCFCLKTRGKDYIAKETYLSLKHARRLSILGKRSRCRKAKTSSPTLILLLFESVPNVYHFIIIMQANEEKIILNITLCEYDPEQ